MTRRHWNQVVPTDVPRALQLCADFALEKRNLSVQRITDLMGEASHNTMYKWMGTGRMPVIKVSAFEHICGINYVTRFLAHSSNKLLIDMPTGRRAEHRELIDLAINANQTTGMLMDFFEGRGDAETVSAAITALIEDLALQRNNVEKFKQPELLLGGSDA